MRVWAKATPASRKEPTNKTTKNKQIFFFMDRLLNTKMELA
jgi:hypothetical protein